MKPDPEDPEQQIGRTAVDDTSLPLFAPRVLPVPGGPRESMSARVERVDGLLLAALRAQDRQSVAELATRTGESAAYVAIRIHALHCQGKLYDAGPGPSGRLWGIKG